MERTTRLFADCHVHFHDCFEPERFFRAAAFNFHNQAVKCAAPRPYVGYLFLTEAGATPCLARLREIGKRVRSPHCRIEATEEEQSAILRAEELVLFLVAGTQTRTRENLEVLALGLTGPLVPEQTLQRTIEQTLNAGAIPVIPWGFGKWWWRRGKLLRDFLATVPAEAVYLGDNAGRSAWSKGPDRFSPSGSRHRFVLPGSDPLPFPDQVNKAGSYGCLLEGHLNCSRPFESFATALKSQTVQPPVFGDLTGFVRFLLNQFRMQLLKRRLP